MSGIWKNKLAAWVHDPAEKALVLLQDQSGHTGGTVKALHEELGIELEPENVKRADRWAAGADRPQWPRNKDDGHYSSWCQVRFAENPVLIHPLTGQQYDLRSLGTIDFRQVKVVSIEHFRKLLELAGSDERLRFLTFWRFGPHLDVKQLANLWKVLPADTRIPDHSIWNHLDLVSAFAGVTYDGDRPALLAMSFGPVQSFIAQSRSTSDLWAGSHLLSSLVWEAMQPIAEALGPDAFLFPQIRGLALVDAWLLETAEKHGKKEEFAKWFETIGEVDFLRQKSDSNPMFAACLPNKFLALVPQRQARSLAEAATRRIRETALRWALDAASKVADSNEGAWKNQVERQLADCPQVFWAVVDWPGTIAGDDFAVLKCFRKKCSSRERNSSNQIPVCSTRLFTPSSKKP